MLLNTILILLLSIDSVLNMSEVRFKVTMVMSPTQRPAGVLGFWASLMTALGNTENMPVSMSCPSFFSILHFDVIAALN